MRAYLKAVDSGQWDEEKNGLFPLIVWTAMGEKRFRYIERIINKLGERQLFSIVLFDEAGPQNHPVSDTKLDIWKGLVMTENDRRQRLKYGANLAVTALMFLRELDAETQEVMAHMKKPRHRARIRQHMQELHETVEDRANSLLNEFLDEL